ncbi:carbohydrate binding family 9 domain-containing protein [Lysobacter enzymogenes]|uniref:Membrane associated hydrolase n=1 Tax=Lysobacter enzymogenes TaxID=69 RepID=A0A0S2DBJ4_LYSEN|nr:carbohydrate binding family 9 domain-containing protein [Lysobacter enzymogenes]ALN55894.1 membrane associated hydrolase [Lysobacter enzymogenes]QCW24859.1 carbohydrate binding family 9 domain-containing protein [Lysobacter enzymogenes]QQQ00685.1 carbohydrate binding family 9 domain-containing protein [Lysobacter enzymogenes]
MRRKSLWLAMLGLLSASFCSHAQDVLDIPRTEHAPRLEDYIGKIPANAGAEVKDFRQNKPGDGVPSTLETRAYLSYDDHNLYVVFVCKDDPKQVRARIARRDAVFGDDGVQLMLDTYHDKQRAFVFTVNPYGAQMDSRYTEGPGYDFNFDTQWVSDGQITDDGYVTMMQIPFKSLRFERGSKQDWGIAVNRIVPRTNEFVYWPYITERKEGFVAQFATARIDDDLRPGRNIQVIPHMTYRDAQTLGVDSAGRPDMRGHRRSELGVDAKFVIKDSIAVDLTVNPDFGEVETDEPQVIVNERYEQNILEKRPFFLENSGIFTSPVSMFYSRRIVNPQYGARVSGRLGRWAVGGLLMDDEYAGATVGGDDAGKTGKIGIARVQRDIGQQSNLGVFLSDRSVGDQYNRVFSVDSRMKLNDSWSLNAQAAHSNSEEAEGYKRDGRLFFLQAIRGGRNFNFDGQYFDASKDFEAELAYLPRVDIRQLYQKSSYLKQFPEAPWLISMGPTLTAQYTVDQGNDVQDWSVEPGFVVNGLLQTKFEGNLIRNYETFAGKDFYMSGFTIGASTEWWRWLTAEAKITVRDKINYTPAAGLEPFMGDQRLAIIKLTISPFAQLRIDQSFIWDELRTQHSLAGQDSDSRVFSTTQSRTKIKYQFSRFWAAHVIFDYRALDSNQNLFAIPRGKKLVTDLLVSYSPNPGTAFYLGYTDQQENLRINENPNIVVPTRGLDMHTGKQLFMKFSYLFNF